LVLREDNADLRLRDKGREAGLVSDHDYQLYLDKKRSIQDELFRIKMTGVKPTPGTNSLLQKKGSSETNGEVSLEQLLKRPELDYGDIARISPSPVSVTKEVAEQVEIQVKYEGYIRRQLDQIERLASLEGRRIPENMDYDTVAGLGAEVRQKLRQVRPVSLGQALRISGVTPAAVSLLLVYLERRKRGGPKESGCGKP